MDRNRRRIIQSLGAATASTLAAPYLNLAHAQSSPIPLGVALPRSWRCSKDRAF